jgi:uncharacterized membrane protein
MKIGKYNLHLHSIFVHFTNALYPAALFFLILSYYYRFEYSLFAYFHLMILATTFVPVSYMTGVGEWKQKYRGFKTRIFLRKIQYGLVSAGLGLLCTLWYGYSPDIVHDTGVMRLIFLLCNFAILPIIFYLGYLGGRLVFGGAH